MTQLSIPVPMRLEDVMRKKTLGSSIELCAELAGFSLDKELQQILKVDKAQFSRWHTGEEGIKWDKFTSLMDTCGNDAPLFWMLYQRSYDLYSIRKTESATEKQLRLAQEENAALRRALKDSL